MLTIWSISYYNQTSKEYKEDNRSITGFSLWFFLLQLPTAMLFDFGLFAIEIVILVLGGFSWIKDKLRDL